MSDDEDIFSKFQAVCPGCTEVFEMDEEVLKQSEWESQYQSVTKLTCPQCGHVQTFDI